MSKKDQDFLVHQTLVFNNNNSTGVDTIIRKVTATSKYEAIGKFLENTITIAADKKLNVIAFPIKDLLKID